jgi:hypothetical protein
MSGLRCCGCAEGPLREFFDLIKSCFDGAAHHRGRRRRSSPRFTHRRAVAAQRILVNSSKSQACRSADPQALEVARLLLVTRLAGKPGRLVGTDRARGPT